MKHTISETELLFSFVRSSGAGGQNVNKVNSKAVLHWHVMYSKNLPLLVKNRFMEKWKNKISSQGYLVLTSDTFRDQEKNIQDILDKLDRMIDAVWLPPKVRKKTRPTRSSVEKRLKAKKEKTSIKNTRKAVSWE